MTTTIESKNGNYVLLHDGTEMSPEDAIKHFENNGHLRESIGFVAPCMQAYDDMNRIAKCIDNIFDRKFNWRR